MCGIIGEMNDVSVDLDTFETMRDSMQHRGPDDASTYSTADGSVALGHRRLSIIDLSDAGCQPMPNEDDTIWLVFNGEIYNFQSLREELVDAGHTFRSDTDSEVIIHGYEEWGRDCVERLRGMFAFGIWDERCERFFLARDRLGIKPLYYYQSYDRFIFSSELKGIVADPSIDRGISDTAVRQFFKYRYVPAPNTIWEGIHKVPPGTCLTVTNEDLQTERYWDMSDFIGNDQDSEQEVVETLSQKFGDAVRSQLVSDVPISVLLSGGIDSSLIAAHASEETDDVGAITVGVGEFGYNELEYARTVADTFGLDHFETKLSNENLDEPVNDLFEYFDEPFADPAMVPLFLLMSEVEDRSKVALTGAGADELFMGYRWHKRYQKYDDIDVLRPLFRSLRDAFGPHLPEPDRSWNQSIVNQLLAKFELACLSPLDRYQRLVYNNFTDDEIDQLVGGVAEEDSEISDPFPSMASDSLTSKDLQQIDLNTILPNDILLMFDRASMAHSLEVRVPFLDHRLVEYVLDIDKDILFSGRQKKHLLKGLAKDRLPPEIRNRGKVGFGIPVGDIVDRYSDVLTNSTAVADGVLNGGHINDILNSDTESSKVFLLIIFELWYRRWATEADSAVPI